MAWLSARTDFAFGDRLYAAGEVFEAPPIDAVRMIAARQVTYARKPSEPAPVAAPKRSRRTYTTKAVQPEPEPVQPAPEPTLEDMQRANQNDDAYPASNLYTRKDLRADD